MRMLITLFILLFLLDMTAGTSRRVGRSRLFPVLAALRILMAAAAPGALGLALNVLAGQPLAASGRVYVEPILARYDQYALWSMIALPLIAILFSVMALIRARARDEAGLSGIRAACRISMALNLAVAVVFGFHTINKFIDVASFALALSLCQNGYLYLPLAIGRLLSPKEDRTAP